MIVYVPDAIYSLSLCPHLSGEELRRLEQAIIPHLAGGCELRVREVARDRHEFEFHGFTVAHESARSPGLREVIEFTVQTGRREGDRKLVLGTFPGRMAFLAAQGGPTAFPTTMLTLGQLEDLLSKLGLLINEVRRMPEGHGPLQPEPDGRGDRRRAGE